MKLLTATKETQGQRKNDFCWCNEGELVRFGFECDNATPDDSCGCARSMCGFTSQTGTTTMKVRECDLDHRGLCDAVRTSLKDGGWLQLCPIEEGNAEIEAIATELERIGKAFSLGSIIEKRGDQVRQRISKAEEAFAA